MTRHFAASAVASSDGWHDFASQCATKSAMRSNGDPQPLGESSAHVVQAERSAHPSAESDTQSSGQSTTEWATEGWRGDRWDDLPPSTVRRYEGVWTKRVHVSIGKQPMGRMAPSQTFAGAVALTG